MPAFLFPVIMQFPTIDIILALNLIIPFHGIFISLFFFNRSICRLTPNFFLGLLLFILSSLILFSLIFSGHRYLADLNFSQYYLCDLLISPFLFLYNSIMIRPYVQSRAYSHLLIIALDFLVLYMIIFFSSPLNNLLTILFTLINGLYMSGSVILLIEMIREVDFSWRNFLISGYSRIIFVNLLIVCTILLSLILHFNHSVGNIYFTQIPKAFLIYYIYYLILRKA